MTDLNTILAGSAIPPEARVVDQQRDGVFAGLHRLTCGALSVSSRPQNVSPTHTRLFLVRSKNKVTRLPAQASGTVTSR